MNSDNNESVRTQSNENRRFEKRLGRGLEDVSYLFLSQSVQPSERRAADDTAAAQSATGLVSSGTPLLLRAYPNFSREMLISFLSEESSSLEEGLSILDKDIPCDPFGIIDLLAVDESDRLSIIIIDIIPSDEAFLRGIACFDWIARNQPIIRRIYREPRISYSLPPKLFLIAPDFSSLLKCAVQRTVNPKIYCFTYRTATVSSGAGILLEPAIL
jgi:hypothetical protein